MISNFKCYPCLRSISRPFVLTSGRPWKKNVGMNTGRRKEIEKKKKGNFGNVCRVMWTTCNFYSPFGFFFFLFKKAPFRFDVLKNKKQSECLLMTVNIIITWNFGRLKNQIYVWLGGRLKNIFNLGKSIPPLPSSFQKKKQN